MLWICKAIKRFLHIVRFHPVLLAIRSYMASESQLRDFLVLNAKPVFLGKGGGSPGITVFADYIHLRTRRGTDVLFTLPEIISVPGAQRLFMIEDKVIS